MKFSTSAYFLLCGLLPIWQGTKAADVRCFPEVHCEGGLIQTVFTPRECCIENAIGVSYDYSGQIEKCHTCEVLGWRKAHLYAVENTDISFIFGNLRGAAENQYILKVEYVSNEANADVIKDSHLTRISYSAIDIEVKVRLPRYNSIDRYTAKNTTLRMAKQLPAALSEAQFIYPEEVTLHVIVPAVSFERSDYSIEYSENLAVTVCLSYDNTGGGHAQFSVNVSVTGQGGGFSKTHRFGFTALSGRSCDSVSLPLSAVHDPFTDTVFSVAIVHQDQPPFDLGPNSSVSLTVKALIATVPEVQFEESQKNYTLPVTFIETCLVRTSPDEMDSTLPLTVNVSLSRGMTSASQAEIISVVFAENSTRSCLSLTLTPAEVEHKQSFKLVIVATRSGLPTFKVGSRSSTMIVVGEREGEDVAVDIVRNAGLDRDSSDSSGPDNWVIGVAVAVPVLLLLVIIATTAIIGALVYHFKHPAVPQDSHIPPEKA